MASIEKLTKEECCGCSACYAVCPEDAISMKPDNEEGFLYPEIDHEKCINCGLCLKVCSKEVYYAGQQEVYACKSDDDEIRLKSSSGGVFTHIAMHILERNGIICGAGYSEDQKELRHYIISSSDELDNLRRSKFLQSDKHEVYRKIKYILSSATPPPITLFCGTPCEVAGLRKYLNHEYEELVTCDLICGCVSSPLVYRKYIEYMNEKYKSEALRVNFKDKRSGWHEKGISIRFRNGEEYYNSILDDDYVVSFHSRYNIRPSCFACRYRNISRTSDLTLGDFWGIENYDASMDDNRGISFVLANTPKGRSIISNLKGILVRQIRLNIEDYAERYNWCLYRNPTKMPMEDRKKFYHDVRTMRFDKMSELDLKEIKAARKKRKQGA